jgi:hypothetical protein
MLGEESHTDPVSDMASVVVPIGTSDFEFEGVSIDDPLATARRLVHDNVVHGRSWEDIVLVPPGRKVPEQIRDLELAAPPDELEQLRRQLDLIQRSKVWRYSMPLRRVRSMFRKH